jgi:hypothetical protein
MEPCLGILTCLYVEKNQGDARGWEVGEVGDSVVRSRELSQGGQSPSVLADITLANAVTRWPRDVETQLRPGCQETICDHNRTL